MLEDFTISNILEEPFILVPINYEFSFTHLILSLILLQFRLYGRRYATIQL